MTQSGCWWVADRLYLVIVGRIGGSNEGERGVIGDNEGEVLGGYVCRAWPVDAPAGMIGIV